MIRRINNLFYKLCFESTEQITTKALNSILLNIQDRFDFFKQLFENALANMHNLLYLQTTIHGKRAKSILIFKHLELHKSFFSPSKQPDS